MRPTFLPAPWLSLSVLLTLGACNRDDNHPDPACEPVENAEPMPSSATEYAAMCEAHGLGVVPTVRCDEGVQVPIRVDGEDVTRTPQSCDHSSMLKPTCDVGSRIGRVEGRAADGTALPEVTWIYFCRATAVTELSSVQMVGYHNETGATCFFEANETEDSVLPETLGRDEQGGLTGQLPGPGDRDFDRAFIPPPVQCVQCHQNNPFIRNPWLDGARLPEDPDVPVLPALSADSPYYVVGGGDWDMRTIHIEGNDCLSCHRIGMEIDQIFAANGVDVNDYMPPSAPGTLYEAYEALLDCWDAGPENTPGCDWVIPPAGGCEGGIVDGTYPYAAADFNGGDGGKDGGDDGSGCPDPFDPDARCEDGDDCRVDGIYYKCEGGVWQGY